jgi:hypothetical protein
MYARHRMRILSIDSLHALSLSLPLPSVGQTGGMESIRKMKKIHNARFAKAWIVGQENASPEISRYTTQALLLIKKHETPHLNASPARCVGRGLRVVECSMWAAARSSGRIIRQTRPFRVRTLDEHCAVWRHVLDVVKLVFLVWCDAVGPTFDLVAFCR